jgi:hypothetical protein
MGPDRRFLDRHRWSGGRLVVAVGDLYHQALQDLDSCLVGIPRLPAPPHPTTTGTPPGATAPRSRHRACHQCAPADGRGSCGTDLEAKSLSRAGGRSGPNHAGTTASLGTVTWSHPTAVGITLGIKQGQPVLRESIGVLAGDSPARWSPVLSAGRCCLRIRRLGVRIPPSAHPSPRYGQRPGAAGGPHQQCLARRTHRPGRKAKQGQRVAPG